MTDRTYHIVSRYLVSTGPATEQGWKNETIVVTGSYEAAGREASRLARLLDSIYSNGHFWTVDCVNPETDSSYFQLFHGRLS